MIRPLTNSVPPLLAEVPVQTSFTLLLALECLSQYCAERIFRGRLNLKAIRSAQNETLSRAH